MKLHKKFITSITFFLALFGLAAINISENFDEFDESLTGYFSSNPVGRTSLTDYVAQVNDFMNENVPFRYEFFDAYGYIQKLMFKKEFNNFTVVEAENGQLFYTYFTTGPNSTSKIASRMSRLAEAAEKTGAQTLYLMTPDKFEPGVTTFEVGMPYNYANETADQFLSQMDAYGVNTIDFRQLMAEEDMHSTDAFYNTDHHWKIETAFWAFTELAKILESDYQYDFKDIDYATNLENYNKLVYEDAYLGSMGRSVGQLYTSPEDISIIYPKFETNYFVYQQSGDVEETKEGPFEESMLSKEILLGNDGKYAATSDKYFTYLNGNPGIEQIQNFDNPDGPKVLFIKDSLIVPVAAFFAYGASQTTLVDPRYFEGNIEDIVAEGDYDYIFVTYSPLNLTEEFFPFYDKTEGVNDDAG